ncbi:hypothetical protein FY528_00050 [Hymenobacter lutimineralis]|uniref:Uncharacterized protein n=1 Tax=Hymenobacter lutimineralis TaxID=2606448 RepID=A0A5D6VGB9_9BACT|nr:hypothetical protein [Hymenobacter lutimineralis]TYZ14162.1 hypothetical protein FY528_00050 [Hymenobacter lutimineralis]
MKKACLTLTLALLAAAPAALAQTEPYRAPAGYSFRDAEDYASYAPQVIEAANWLEVTPLDQQPDTRRATNQFVLQWVSGSPAVKVKLQTFVTELSRQEPNYMMLFLAGWARYQLQHPAEKDALTLNMAGLTPVLKMYQANPAKKNKVLDELLQEQANGTLQAWVQKRVLP